MTNGSSYLATYRGDVAQSGVTTRSEFDDFRLITGNIAGEVITFTGTNILIGQAGDSIAFNIAEATVTGVSLELHNDDTNENVFTVDYVTEVMDLLNSQRLTLFLLE